MLKSLALAVAIGVALLPSAAVADDIPEMLVGLWAPQGQCDAATGPVYIGRATLQAADQDVPAPAVWFENDSPSGNGAIHWAEEGVVSNFEYDADLDALLYNEQGYGMGVAPIAYERCPN